MSSALQEINLAKPLPVTVVVKIIRGITVEPC